MTSLIHRSRALMRRQTIKNGAPTWALTEIAVAKGKELAKKYKVSEELVVSALYLAHVVFSPDIKGKIQRNHEELSARFVDKYLKRWKVHPKNTETILNAIRAHHEKVPSESKIAEVMKNAECFKFITIPGALIYLHTLGTRNMPFLKALAQVRRKADQKFSYISLPGIKKDASRNYHETIKVLDSIAKIKMN